MILWPWPMKFYAELAGITTFIVNGLQFQKWVNAEFFMQTPLLKEKKSFAGLQPLFVLFLAFWIQSVFLFIFDNKK